MDAVTIDQFVQLLSKSELLSAEKTQLVEQAAAKAGNSEQLARFLMRQGILTGWQAGQLLIGNANFMLGKYRLIHLLGKGGMGSVFLAEHVTMNRRVALKLVPKGLEKNPVAMERFMAEARAIATVDHPNIVQAYSVDNEADRFYIVMEYVDGRDLERIVTEEGPLDYARAADYIRQAAEGLAHAHGRGMIHCDIKPSNLLVNSQGVVKILDLGLARLSGEEENEDAAKANEHILGTVDYMAPEQAMNAKTFDHRADLYSLGCTMYYLLTGHAPFPEGTLAQRIVKHQTQQPANIIEQRPDAPPQLVRICRKMMAKEPNDRYASAEEVIRALDDLNLDQSIKRAVPLDQIADDAPTTAGSETSAIAAQSSPTFKTRSKVVGKAALSAKRARPQRPVNLAPLVMWGAVALVAALIVTGLTAVVLLKKSPSAHVVQPASKAPVEAIRAPASHSSFPSMQFDSAPVVKPAPPSGPQSATKAKTGVNPAQTPAKPAPEKAKPKPQTAPATKTIVKPALPAAKNEPQSK